MRYSHIDTRPYGNTPVLSNGDESSVSQKFEAASQFMESNWSIQLSLSHFSQRGSYQESLQQSEVFAPCIDTYCLLHAETSAVSRPRVVLSIWKMECVNRMHSPNIQDRWDRGSSA